jgi:sulfite exporter TauE/SafE
MDTFFSVKHFNVRDFLELGWMTYSIFTLVTLNTLFVFSLFDSTVNLSMLSYLNELKKLVFMRVAVSIIYVIINIQNNIEENNSVLWKIYNEQKRQSKRLKRAYRSS